MQFKDIHGHEALKARLIETVNKNRVSHAQLFFGPEGSGNLAVALAYAQYVSCTNKQENDSCGECPSCQKYQKLAHPDLHFIFPVSTTSVVTKNPMSENFLTSWRELLLEKNAFINISDWYNKIGLTKNGIINARDCNEIVKKLSLKPYESEYKVMVIWMVEKLFHSAAPKILKILEEPPEKTLFLLIAEETDKILKTILSRTQMVKVPAYKDTDIQAYLEKTRNSEEARQLALLAGGSLIRAKELQEEEVKTSAHFTSFSNWMRMCFSLEKEGLAKINDFVNDLSREKKEDIREFLFYGMEIFRNSLMYHTGNERMIRFDGDEKVFLQKFSPFVHKQNLPVLYKAFNESVYHIDRNANLKMLLTTLSLRVSAYLQIKATATSQ